MARQNKRGNVIELAAMSKKEFDSSFRGSKNGNSLDPKDYVKNVEIKTFNGQTFENDGRGSNVATVLVNFAKMSSYFGNKGTGFECQYSGSTDGDTPVYVDKFTDFSDAVDPEKVAIQIDATALAGANFAERVANIEAKNAGITNPEDKIPMPNQAGKDRVDVKYAFSTTHNGVAGMSADGFAKNIAKAAGQRYILTASPKDPSKEGAIPTKADMETVAKMFSDTYGDMAAKAVKDGLKPMKSTNGKVIEGTDVNALSSYGVHCVKVDGATVLATSEKLTADQKSALNKELVKFNKAFNNTMSQQINAVDSKSIKALGNMMGVNAYAVDPMNSERQSAGITVIQPSATAMVQPFSGALDKAFDAATHRGVGGVVKTPAELYGQEILKNAQAITSTFDTQALEPEKAKEALDNQLSAIQNAVEKDAAKAGKSKDAEGPTK